LITECTSRGGSEWRVAIWSMASRRVSGGAGFRGSAACAGGLDATTRGLTTTLRTSLPVRASGRTTKVTLPVGDPAAHSMAAAVNPTAAWKQTRMITFYPPYYTADQPNGTIFP